jgi:hypothetical protein
VEIESVKGIANSMREAYYERKVALKLVANATQRGESLINVL